MVEFVCPNCFKRGYIPTLVNEEDMIPRAKVEAKIKELENHYTVGLNRFDKNWSDYDMATNANRAILSHLQELLNDTEKVEGG